MTDNPTIFALSSGTVPSAIGVIRVSGPQAGAALAALAGRMPTARRASLARLRDGAGALLDEALVLWFPGPNTATGEDLAEMHCHGGRAVITAVEGPGRTAGPPPCRAGRIYPPRLCQWPDRSRRGGRLADLLSAETELACAAALANAGGALSRQVEAWRERWRWFSPPRSKACSISDDEDATACRNVSREHCRARRRTADMARPPAVRAAGRGVPGGDRRAAQCREINPFQRSGGERSGDHLADCGDHPRCD